MLADPLQGSRDLVLIDLLQVAAVQTLQQPFKARGLAPLALLPPVEECFALVPPL